MKKHMKRIVASIVVIAVIVSSVLISSNFSSAPKGSEDTVESIADLVLDDHESDAEETKEKESTDSHLDQGGKKTQTDLGNDLVDVDYEKIKEEISDETYRETVDIEENAFVIVRKEDSSSVPIEEEDWYEEVGATAHEIIVKDDESTVSYRITTEKEDMWAVVDYANTLDSVEIAEPEYVYSISATGVPSSSNNVGMSKQWYLNDQKSTDIWANQAKYGNATGEGAVVAVIDTGVDYNHEDLHNNMWINTAELSGQDGVDDDNNGYVDDIYGINLIDPAANPLDDHGHGTHVAGIIAMEDNNVGGVGIAYKSRIMTIKAGGADGTFNSSDIAKALTYAYKNGADVINMSFGSYAHSAIVESALQNAFSSSVLVAAAGNDSLPTLDGIGANMYPAAYSYVIGVMAYDNAEKFASFSNWDYKQNYGAEYEVVAPGAGIYSTLPENRYASWDGTSMAAPMVSAVAAVLRSSMPDKDTYSSRYIMGQIVSASEDTIEHKALTCIYQYTKLSLMDSLTKKAKPNINVDEVYIFDSTHLSEGNNGDGIVQPGETIDIAVGLRNQWGAAKNVNITVSATSDGGVENPYVEFLTGKQTSIGEIGTFGTQNNGFTYNEHGIITGVSNPIRVKVLENAPNDLNIQFHINYTAENALDSADKTVYKQKNDTLYTVSVVKGTVLEGKITKDMTLSSDNYYIVKNSVLIPRGVTVNVEPGTQIQFWGSDQSTVYADEYIAYISVQGKLNFNGTEAEPIELFPGKDYERYRVQIEKDGNGTINMSYVNIINPYINISTGDHLNMVQDYDTVYHREYDYATAEVSTYEGNSRIIAEQLVRSKVSNIRGNSLWSYADVQGKYDTVLFDNCQISYSSIEAVNCTFLNNQGRVEDQWSGTLQYFSSRMNNVGNRYRTPQYETVSDIHTLNGKKYVVYKFDNYVFDDYWDENGNYYSPFYENYLALEKGFSSVGGHIAAVDLGDPYVRKMLQDIYIDIYGDDESNTNGLNMTAGYYYDKEREVVTSTNGTEMSDGDRGLSNSCPISYISSYWTQTTDYEYNETTGNFDLIDVKIINSDIWATNGMHSYVIAEYPDSVSDYNVENPVFDLKEMGVMESTKFTNNAILNRLTSKDVTDWMRVTSPDSNAYTFMISGNYWGTNDEAIIQKQLLDFDTNIRYADIITEPHLTEPDKDTYPCVSNIYITDKEGKKVSTLANGTYSVHVVFNRDMDTSVNPMVTYGPDDPYTDYVVEGSWTSSKEWVGTAKVNILVNQGQQYFRVKDAVAASDRWLTTGTDWARFGFMIEASGAEALTLQGEGVKGGVYLNWVQDEYDTMAGFNIYRSDSGEPSTYTKANSSIISKDEKEYTDTKVESGKNYYYYFTVVDTDMTESRPSNVIICASLDDQPPVITHKAAKSVVNGINATITATIKDNVGVNSAILYYRMQGEATYKQALMKNTSDNTYSVQVPAKDLSVGTLEYYIVAADSMELAYSGSSTAPYQVPVESTAVITSVAAEDTEVGDEVQGTIKGINFTENYVVRIEGNAAETEFVSDTEIRFKYVPTYMGKKKVELMEGNVLVASYTNAFNVTDSSIKIYNEEVVIIKESSNWVYVYLDTNYVGKLESISVSFTQEDDIPHWETYQGCIQSENEYDGNIITKTFKYGSNTTVNEDRLLYAGYYYRTNDNMPDIKSIKINGVEVTNIDYVKERVSFIDQSAYIPVEEVRVEEPAVTLDVGESFKPVYTISPSNATMIDTVTYDYDRNSLKQNEDGSFTALRSGGHDLWVRCDQYSDKVYVYVNPVPITSITPDKTSYRGVEGSSVRISAIAEPLNSDVYISWWSSNGNIADIIANNNNGRDVVVNLRNAGDVIIYAEASNPSGVTARCEVSIEVLENTAYVDISEDIMTLSPNQSIKATAQIVNGSSGGADKINWSSSNTAVATVNTDGTISAVAPGYAIITGSVTNGQKEDSVIILVGSDSSNYVVGDVNMDGSITSTDAMLTLKLALKDNITTAIRKVADVNADGKVASSDAMLILQYVTGAISKF